MALSLPAESSFPFSRVSLSMVRVSAPAMPGAVKDNSYRPPPRAVKSYHRPFTWARSAARVVAVSARKRSVTGLPGSK